MKNKGIKQKSKKKGSDNAFGCDLIEHLESSGQDVPQVLKTCAEFIEEHGVVDGIYRLSGVTSNIQRLRQEFNSEACPDLRKEVYLQDIHCVGSLCKLYFRELPNPLLTYELYSKFTEVVKVQGEHERLLYIRKVVKELPGPHFRTLEFLTKHLAHLATLSTQTNMHARNLALVWAPNLLRCKDIEVSAGNGDMAFQAVRIQQSVVEFILNHTEQIFSNDSALIKPKEGAGLMCAEKYATLPIGGQCGPMKLMSLEEAQARSLSPNHPVHRERQRENSLPDTSTATLYHTVIDIDSKRKLSGKSKKWRSIFNLGRSVDSKGKLNRNGSVFIRTPGITEKAALRPSRSMESLCSLPTDDDSSSPAGIFAPDVKSRTLGSDSLYDLSESDQTWEFKGNKTGEASGGWSPNMTQKGAQGASVTPPKTLPEQLKVYKGEDLSNYKPTSPKNRRMLYNSSSRPSFPGSFFPLESSPRHQRRAVNISEPFAVSVPLRVSAVISSNSTPCRGHIKDKAATLKPCKESSEQGSNSGKGNSFPQLETKKKEGTEKKNTEEVISALPSEDKSKDISGEGQEKANTSNCEPQILTKESEDAAPSPGKELKKPSAEQLETHEKKSTEKDLWSDLHQELKITEPEMEQLDETFKPVFSPKSSCEVVKSRTADVKSKLSRSSPSLSLLFQEPSSNPSQSNRIPSTGSGSATQWPSDSNISISLHKDRAMSQPANSSGRADKSTFIKREDPAPNNVLLPLVENGSDKVMTHLVIEDNPTVLASSAAKDTDKNSEKQKVASAGKSVCDGSKNSVVPRTEVLQRLSLCLEEKHNTLELPHLENDEGSGGNSEELDLLEPWEDFGSTKQWVTSPLHSPDVEELFNQLSPFGSHVGTLRGETKTSPPADDTNRQSFLKSTEDLSGSISPPSIPKTNWTYLPSRGSVNITQPHPGKGSTPKQKNTLSTQKFYRQMSFEAAAPERREEHFLAKHRPYSLNLDSGHRCIRDISNQQNRNLSELSSCQRGSLTSSGGANNGLPSDLELFLSDRQAPLRRNSAPVSVSSVRTAFMIKTCQAKAVPVIPPRVQYSQIPHSRQDSDADVVRQQDKDKQKMSVEKSNTPPPVMLNLQEELENKEPALKQQKQVNVEKCAESVRTTSTPELPVITRRHAPGLEVFVDGPRPNRGNILQRPSFRNRQRPQSLILLSPPFPIMDYPPSGDDGKLKSLNDTSAGNVKEENYRMAEGIALQNKMTIPKSGQRLETSTSCFYQPQRRSMIFESRSQRQIE